MLLIDPDFPVDTRWVATSPLVGAGTWSGNPSFTPDGSALVAAGFDEMTGPSLVGLDGESRLFAGDVHLSNDRFGDLRYPIISSTGQMYGVRPVGSNRIVLCNQDPAVPHLTSVWGGGALPVQDFLPSANGTYYTGMNTDFMVYAIGPNGEHENPNWASATDGIAWSPVEDVLAYGGPAGSCDSDPNQDCDKIRTWNVHTSTTTDRVVAQNMQGGFSFSPNGAHLAYSCGGTDCCGGSSSQTVICTTSGISVPPAPGFSDTNPVWSPDGTAIAFLRQSTLTSPPGRKALMVWHPGDPQATALTGAYLGFSGWEQTRSFSPITWVTIPQQ
jgi:Tol biopolymer transport system component